MVNPRFRSVPAGNGDLGKKAIALAKRAGLVLDDWQQDVLVASLQKRKDGRWAAPDVGLNVARQNGKGAVIVARILAELFLVGSELTIYSAHNFDTALEHFRRIAALVESTPELASQLIGEKGRMHYGITWGKGNEGIALESGPRLQIRTRTASGGRGFSCDLLILDEAMILPEFMHSALEPIVSARPNPQIWYTGSAVDQQVHEHGIVWTRVREQGMAGMPDLAYFEWSAEGDDPDQLLAAELQDRAKWMAANPAMGIRISAEHVQREANGKLSPRGFAVERLGIGDWPRTDHVSGSPITLEAWQELIDEESFLVDPICLAFDVSPDRRGAIAAAGRRPDGLFHVEVVNDKTGTAWMHDRIVALLKKHKPLALICDGYGPAANLVRALEDEYIEVTKLTASEHGQACASLVDLVNEKAIRHLGTTELRNAVGAAQTRPLGDAWAWSRKNSTANIAPLVAVTLALSGIAAFEEEPEEAMIAWA